MAENNLLPIVTISQEQWNLNNIFPLSNMVNLKSKNNSPVMSYKAFAPATRLLARSYFDTRLKKKISQLKLNRKISFALKMSVSLLDRSQLLA